MTLVLALSTHLLFEKSRGRSHRGVVLTSSGGLGNTVTGLVIGISFCNDDDDDDDDDPLWAYVALKAERIQGPCKSGRAK